MVAEQSQSKKRQAPTSPSSATKPSKKKRANTSKKNNAKTTCTPEAPSVSAPSPTAPKAAPNGLPLYPEKHVKVPFPSENPESLPTPVTRFVTWNVASLRAVSKNGTFDAYIKQERPHILCIQETKMTEEAVKSFVCPPGYSVHWFHSERKGYSGVAVFLRDDHVFFESEKSRCNEVIKLVKIDHGINDSIADSEGRVMTLHLTFKDEHVDSNHTLCLVVAYVPNAGGKLARLGYRTKEFEPALRNHLKSLSDKGHSIIYCGDLNVAYEEIDIHDSKSNKKSAGHTAEERHEFGQLLEHDSKWIDCYRALYPEYPGYTYYSRRFGARLRQAGKGWRLDYFLMDQKSHSKDAIVDCFVRPDTEGSDHYPLILDVDMHKIMK